jgi:hypothetical protein
VSSCHSRSAISTRAAGIVAYVDINCDGALDDGDDVGGFGHDLLGAADPHTSKIHTIARAAISTSALMMRGVMMIDFGAASWLVGRSQSRIRRPTPWGPPSRAAALGEIGSQWARSIRDLFAP